MPQSAGIVFDAGNLASGMPHEMRLVATERLELGVGEESAVSKNDVERLDRVTLALDVAITRRGLAGLR